MPHVQQAMTVTISKIVFLLRTRRDFLLYMGRSMLRDSVALDVGADGPRLSGLRSRSRGPRNTTHLSVSLSSIWTVRTVYELEGECLCAFRII